MANPFTSSEKTKDIGLSVLVFCIYMFAALDGGKLKFAIGYFAYLLLSALFAKKYTFSSAALIGLFPLFIPLAVHATHWHNTFTSLPITLVPFLGFSFGYLAFRNRLYFKITSVAFGLFLSIFFYSRGFNYWKSYVNFGSFNGHQKIPITPFKIQTLQGQVFDVGQNKNDIYVLDFWIITCAPCYASFPEWANWIKQYEAIDGIRFFAVNIFINNQKKGDIESRLKTYCKSDIHPATFAIGERAQIDAELGVQLFPTTIIIQGNQLLFKGNLSNAKQFLKELL